MTALLLRLTLGTLPARAWRFSCAQISRLLAWSAFLVVALVPAIAVATVEEGALSMRGQAVSPDDLASQVATVMIDGWPQFQVVGVSAVPARQRARQVAARIRDLAQNPALDPRQVRLRETTTYTELSLGDAVIVRLFDADARLEGVERSALAGAIQARIQQTIEQYRHERSKTYLLETAKYAGLVLLSLILGLYLSWRLAKGVSNRIERRYRGQIEGLRIQSFEIVRAEHFWSSLKRTVGTVWMLIAVVTTMWCAELILSRLPWTRYGTRTVFELLFSPLRQIVQGLAAFIPNLVFLFVLFLIVRYLLRLGRLLFLGVSAGTISWRGFEADWALPTWGILRVAIVALALVIAFPYLPGSDSEAFKGISIFIGVLFSIGSSSAVANTVAGYLLIYRRVFKEGDRVRIGAVTGDVVERRLQVTHLRTVKNEEVIVPNSTILNSDVFNYTSYAKTQGLVLHTTVGIGYETPWRQVEAMLLIAASRTRGLSIEPKPFVQQLALGDFCVTYELNAYCQDAQATGAVYSEMHRQILDVFNEYGVAIMTPAYVADPPEPKLVRPENWHAAPAAPQEGTKPD